MVSIDFTVSFPYAEKRFGAHCGSFMSLLSLLKYGESFYRMYNISVDNRK